MKGILENGGKAIALASFSLLLLTASHDWAFFAVIGSSFQSFQTTYDYIANAIEWMPFLVLVVVSSFTVARFGGRHLSRYLSRALMPKHYGFIDQRRNQEKKTIKSFTWTVYSGCAIATAITGLMTLFPINIVFLTASALFVIALSIFAFSMNSQVDEEKQALIERAAFALVLFVMLLGTAFIVGILDAAFAIRGGHNVYMIGLNNGTSIQAPLLRSFDKGILIWNIEKQTAEFLRWDKIDNVKHFVALDRTTIACRLLPRFCESPIEP